MIEILTLPVLGVALIAIAVTFTLSCYAISSLRTTYKTMSAPERERIWKAYSYMKVAAICAAIALCSLFIGGYMVEVIING